jgi:molybdenum cofactor cytidylyltransferase
LPTDRAMSVSAIVLAAGRGARFAAADPSAPLKLLVPVAGRPMILHTLERLREGGVARCVIVIPPDAPSMLRATVEDEGVDVVVNPDPSRGMLSSVQAGLAVKGVSESSVVLVMPADMPFVAPASVAAVIEAARGDRTVSPRVGSRGGHPVALSTRVQSAVANAAADITLKMLVEADQPVHLALSDTGLVRDVDVPGDLADLKV